MSDDRVETVALALCHSGKFACDGRCAPICFEFMGNKPKRCGHAARVHGDLAHTVLRTLDPSIESLQAEVGRLKAENDRAWRERNEAYAKVKGWEATVYVEKLPLRAVPIDDWGPGGEGQTSIPDITPQKLTDLLDELARLRQALAAKEQTRDR